MLDVNDYHAFRRARRRAAWEQFRALLTRRSADLLCYGKLRDFLDVTGVEDLGRQQIATQNIIGSVERCSDYSRDFSPRKDSDRGRWVRIKQLLNTGTVLPPIKVYQVGEVYFVVDGHHRVSVARQTGRASIPAQVVAICTRVPFRPGAEPSDLG